MKFLINFNMSFNMSSILYFGVHMVKIWKMWREFPRCFTIFFYHCYFPSVYIKITTHLVKIEYFTNRISIKEWFRLRCSMNTKFGNECLATCQLKMQFLKSIMNIRIPSVVLYAHIFCSLILIEIFTFNF